MPTSSGQSPLLAGKYVHKEQHREIHRTNIQKYTGLAQRYTQDLHREIHRTGTEKYTGLADRVQEVCVLPSLLHVATHSVTLKLS